MSSLFSMQKYVPLSTPKQSC